MKEQTKNALKLYRGGNPSTIKQLLRVQHSSVVNELKELCHTDNLGELAIRLSAGMY